MDTLSEEIYIIISILYLHPKQAYFSPFQNFVHTRLEKRFYGVIGVRKCILHFDFYTDTCRKIKIGESVDCTACRIKYIDQSFVDQNFKMFLCVFIGKR